MTDISQNRLNGSLGEALNSARELYSMRRPASEAAHRTAATVMPGGNTRTVLFHHPFPLRITDGHNQTIRDADGLSYINMLGEYTAGLLGVPIL